MKYEVRTNAIEELGRHHNMETPVKYFYLNLDDTMHVTDYEDVAYKHGKGPRVAIEWLNEDRGYPIVNGKALIIEGIADNGDLKIKEGNLHTTTKIDSEDKVNLKEIYKVLLEAGYTK